ncbi:acyltransferase [Granulicella sp. S156]|uniref:acyltransferase family protein n=1 Tax=Granulicella sp. S156 TaxID=1747224 RepID=UPI00131E6215|nr:acyltransferase [Granulicella sp. S156]
MIHIGSPAFYLLFIVALLSVSGLLARGVKPDPKKLNVPLESLRGLLAANVLACHALVSFYCFRTGQWAQAPSRFYNYIGTESVEMFFFMSAFLFWSKCLSPKGLGGYGNFLLKRFRRLAPAYYVSVSLILLIVLARTHFHLVVAPLAFLGQVALWFLFIPIPTTNGLPVTAINAYVTWTLCLEIIFYLFLPLLFRIFKGYRIVAGIGAAMAIYGFLALRGISTASDFHKTSVAWLIVLFLNLFFGFGFGLGMLLAFIFHKCPSEWLAVLRQRRWTPVPLLCLAAPMLLHVKLYDAPQFLCVIVFFAFVAAGNDLFGLLSWRGVFLLGTVSYSFYLMHGIMLYLMSHGLDRWVRIVSLSPWRYWSFICVVAAVTVCLAKILHRHVELRFMSQRSALAQTRKAIGEPFAHPVIPELASPQ